MGPGPTKGRFTRQKPPFSVLGSKAHHTVRKLRPRLPPSCAWTSWQKLEGPWALAPHWLVLSWNLTLFLFLPGNKQHARLGLRCVRLALAWATSTVPLKGEQITAWARSNYFHMMAVLSRNRQEALLQAFSSRPSSLKKHQKQRHQEIWQPCILLGLRKPSPSLCIYFFGFHWISKWHLSGPTS